MTPATTHQLRISQAINQLSASAARVVGDQLGHHFDQRRALLGEVGVGPRLARVRPGKLGWFVLMRVGVRVRVKSRLRVRFGSRYLKLLCTILRSKKSHYYYSPLSYVLPTLLLAATHYSTYSVTILRSKKPHSPGD